MAEGGQHAAARLAYLEAIAHFEQGLGLLHSLPEGRVRHDREIELQLALGFCDPEARPADGSFLTHRWRKRDSNPRSLPLDFWDEGRVQRQVAPHIDKDIPERVEVGGRAGRHDAVRIVFLDDARSCPGLPRSARLMISVSHQPWAGPK